jgi:dienelactone hydrolase
VRGRPSITLLAAALALPMVLAPAASATADEVPAPPARPAPGPASLHQPPLEDPGLAPGGRWQAPPTMVSGTTVVRDGELVHTGWVFDDNGADTIPVPFVPILVDGDPGLQDTVFSARTGDVVYPTDRDRFAGNAADLVEVRARVDEDAVAFRIVLNTMRAPDVAAVAIGIDTTGSDEVVDWGHGLGTLGPTGVDHVVYTDGVRATLDGLPVASHVDVAHRRIEVEVPRELLDPADDAVWHLYGVSGLADGDGGFVPIAPRPTATQPGGDLTGTAPPVFDVAFRHEDQEPFALLAPEAASGQAGAYGSWRDAASARALAARDVSAFSVELDVALLRSGGTWSDVPSSGTVNRLYRSPLDLGGGIGDARPFFRSDLQPYTVHVPSCVEDGEVPVLTLALHSYLGNHNQYRAASPGFYEQLGEARCSLVVTTLGHGPDGWYLDEAEADLFAVLADVVAAYEVDLDHTLIHGYSMGGYGTYRLVGRHPDLFAAAFPVVGPPAEGIVATSGTGTPTDQLAGGTTGSVDPHTNTTPYLDSFRHVPTLAWHAVADELVPITSAVTHHQRQLDRGYRLRHEVFAAEHLTLAVVDRWERAIEVLGDRPERTADPDHVTYRVQPGRDRADLGLVADHAYWVADVEVRDAERVGGGLVDARSFARGQGEPITTPIVDAGPDPLPYEAHGLAWTGTTERIPTDRLEVALENVGHVTLHLDDRGLLPSERAEVAVTSDGPARLTLVHHAGAVEVLEATDVEVVALHEGWLVVEVADGGGEVVLTGGTLPDGGDGGDGGGDRDPSAAGRERAAATPAGDRPGGGHGADRSGGSGRADAARPEPGDTRAAGAVSSLLPASAVGPVSPVVASVGLALLAGVVWPRRSS